MPLELLIYSLLQLFVAAFYGLDKYKAVSRARRISEKFLLLLAMLAPFGAYIGIFAFRHKTRKWYFIVVSFLFMFVHLGLYFLYQSVKSGKI